MGSVLRVAAVAMSWREIERDDRFRVPFVVYRCGFCRRLGVSTNPLLTMPACSCQAKR